MASLDKPHERPALDQLEALVSELTRPKPREATIQKLMSANGIEYSRDPVTRMQSVLRALHEHEAPVSIEERTAIRILPKNEDV